MSSVSPAERRNGLRTSLLPERLCCGQRERQSGRFRTARSHASRRQLTSRCGGGARRHARPRAGARFPDYATARAFKRRCRAKRSGMSPRDEGSKPAAGCDAPAALAHQPVSNRRSARARLGTRECIPGLPLPGVLNLRPPGPEPGAGRPNRRCRAKRLNRGVQTGSNCRTLVPMHRPCGVCDLQRDRDRGDRI
jgi:hypothetical protein